MYLQIDVPKTDCTHEHHIIAKVSSYRIFSDRKAQPWCFEDPCPLLLDDELISPSEMLLEKHEDWNYYVLGFYAIRNGKNECFNVDIKNVKAVTEIPAPC